MVKGTKMTKILTGIIIGLLFCVFIILPCAIIEIVCGKFNWKEFKKIIILLIDSLISGKNLL